MAEFACTHVPGNVSQKHKHNNTRQNHNHPNRQKEKGPTVFFQPPQPKAITPILDQFQINYPLWNISSVCRANNIAYDANLETAFGLTTNDCLKIYITGKCTTRSCFERTDCSHNTSKPILT